MVKNNEVIIKLNNITKVFDDVIAKSYSLTAVQMVEMTHKEEPWMQAKDSSVISIEAIASYFGSNDPLNLERN